MVVGSTEDFKTHGGIQPGAGLAGRHFYPKLLGQGCGVKSFLKLERTTKEKECSGQAPKQAHRGSAAW